MPLPPMMQLARIMVVFACPPYACPPYVDTILDGQGAVAMEKIASH